MSNVSPAGTTQYLYDPQGHLILETDQNGNSLREYIWLDDMPVAIIDQVNTANPVLYYVHVDHLHRPIMVTNASGASVWNAIWTPFGAPYSITGSLTYNARFPGQWFQIESGLNWNWHRHYDPSTGRYLQPDPMGLATLLSDGPSAYGYVGQSPLAWSDSSGEQVIPIPLLLPPPIPPGHNYTPVPSQWLSDLAKATDIYKLMAVLMLPQAIVCMAEHTKGKRPSTEEKHQSGDARRAGDRGGEEADKRRNPPRKPPPDWDGGAWPPKPENSDK